jgi:hypothetical protein
MSIFSDMIEQIMEVFMERPSRNALKILIKCREGSYRQLGKCHFMVREGIILGHRVSERGIEVDRAKIEVIEQLPPLSNVKVIRSFLGHEGFYRRFIKNFPEIAYPLSKLLAKDVPFVFDEECLIAFHTQESFDLSTNYPTSRLEFAF